MALRSNTIVRVILIVCVFGLGWYTIKLYAGLYGRLKTPEGNEATEEKTDSKSEVKTDDKIKDPDNLIDHEKIKQVEEEWDKAQKLPDVKLPKFPCEMVTKCDADKYSFKVVSGAANVIGPSICFNGEWVMRNVLNNVDRGMNIAVVNGKDGKVTKRGIFDLYGKDSTDLKVFLKGLTEDEVMLATSYDDAAFRLDDEARTLLSDLGSEKAKSLAFRDNWIFVGGKKVVHDSSHETHLKMDKAVNKYGDWPEAVTLEGCLSKL